MNVQDGTLLISRQISVLLRQLPHQVYTRPIALFHGSTIGQHFRHILEFYTCLLDGCGTAYVDYSSRKRNDALSENPEVALEVLESVVSRVMRLNVQQELRVESEFSDARETNPAHLSSIARELQYAFDHTVHHLAIIRMGLETHFPEIPVATELGVAPSTLRHRKENPGNQQSIIFHNP